MKDLTENIEKTKKDLNSQGARTDREFLAIKNQIAIMEALQDIQEKMMRIEGKMRNIK
jgi:hypothetical protein